MSKHRSAILLVFFVTLTLCSGVTINIVSSIIQSPIIAILGNSSLVILIILSILIGIIVSITNWQLTPLPSNISKEEIALNFSKVWGKLAIDIQKTLLLEKKDIDIIIGEINNDTFYQEKSHLLNTKVIIDSSDLETIKLYNTELGSKVQKYLKSRESIEILATDFFFKTHRKVFKKQKSLSYAFLTQTKKHREIIEELESNIQLLNNKISP